MLKLIWQFQKNPLNESQAFSFVAKWWKLTTKKKNVGPVGHQNIARFSKFSTFLSDLQPNLANSPYCGWSPVPLQSQNWGIKNLNIHDFASCNCWHNFVVGEHHFSLDLTKEFERPQTKWHLQRIKKQNVWNFHSQLYQS
jgi:hypothetical protein